MSRRPRTPADPLSALAAHESDMDARDPALGLDLSDPALAAVIAAGSNLTREREALAAESARIEAARAALATEAAEADRRRRFQSLLDRCVPTKIGAYGGIDPTSLDIEIETCLLHNGTEGAIAWVPVPLYPVPIAPTDPSRRTNKFTGKPVLIAGQTSIVRSLAVAPMTTSKPDPRSPSSFLQTRVLLRGFCTLELSDLTLEETEAELARLDLQSALARDDEHPASLSDSEKTLVNLPTPTLTRL